MKKVKEIPSTREANTLFLEHAYDICEAMYVYDKKKETSVNHAIERIDAVIPFSVIENIDNEKAGTVKRLAQTVLSISSSSHALHTEIMKDKFRDASLTDISRINCI